MPRRSSRVQLLSLVVATVVASHAGAETIDEATFVAELEVKDPRLALAAARVAAARADVAEARVRPNPSLSIEREEPFFDGTGIATNYLRLAIPLDISGRRGRRIEAAETGVRAATTSATQTRLEATIEALQVFDDCVRARLQVELLTAERAALVRAVDIARQRGKTGAASGYEVQRFELELAGHDDELASAQIELRRARIGLAALLGRTGELDATGALDLPASVPTLDEVLAKSAVRGDLQGARLRARAAQSREQAAGRGWVPLPTITAGAMTADNGTETGTGYVAGLALSIPIFDHGGAEQARAAAERRLAGAEASVLERQIPGAVQRAHATLLARIAQARQIATGQLERLDTILRAAETAFREGNASVVELLDAHRAARTVRSRALDLRHQVSRDKRELELAVGQRL